MQKEFEMSMMGELTFFLSLQIKQTNNGIFINQEKYTKELIKKFGMENANIAKTPMSTSCRIDKDEDGQKVNQKLYRRMIRSLLYLTASRPDIMFSLCLCARFQASLMESHPTVVKRIFRYLQGSRDYGLYYSKNSNLDLTTYSDADYAISKIDRKSTSGMC